MFLPLQSVDRLLPFEVNLPSLSPIAWLSQLACKKEVIDGEFQYW